jgi:nucleotidyltransferase substrate binding protein (TIGR01987 family)
MKNQDIRWKQRFDNYQKALQQLSVFIKQDKLNNLEKQGLIQCFEYNHELAWKVLADFIKDKGNITIYGLKDTTREAFNLGLIKNGEVWMDMIKSRNITSHTYNEDTTERIVEAIKNQYHQEFVELQKKLLNLL